jgi:hypothetical protein|tara:strand:+ start:10112 stop:10651 length:540 start_codon:yes stop_codon:yes gene_type:complete
MEFRFATATDKDKVLQFCNSQSFSNNTSLEKMKWQWCLDTGAWTVAIVCGRIVSIAGVHSLPEVSPNAYRCLFRGAQLPGHTMGTGRDFFKTGIHFSYMLPMQMEWALAQNPNAELYISTNVNDDGGKSKRANDIAAPLIAKRGVWHLEQTIELYNVPQSLWRINVSKYYEERAKSLGL